MRIYNENNYFDLKRKFPKENPLLKIIALVNNIHSAMFKLILIQAVNLF